jgi:hypothetical protein
LCSFVMSSSWYLLLWWFSITSCHWFLVLLWCNFYLRCIRHPTLVSHSLPLGCCLRRGVCSRCCAWSSAARKGACCPTAAPV